MSVKGFVGLALIVLGVLGLVYGGFSYTEERHDVELGPVELAVSEKKRVNVPVWFGVASIAAGAGLLVFSRRKG